MAFFAMSGYVLARGWDGDFLAFLAKRFVRLWPLFALCFAVGASVRHMTPAWTYFFWYPFVYDFEKSPVLLADSPMWSQFVEGVGGAVDAADRLGDSVGRLCDRGDSDLDGLFPR